MLKRKKYFKIIAWIVLTAFSFQAAPVYAAETMTVPPAVSEEEPLALSEEETMPTNGTDISEETPAEVTELSDEAAAIASEEERDNLLAAAALSAPFGEITPSDRQIDGEIEELREPDVKYFLNEDKTITAAVYPYDVHYMDENGDYQDIDNSLIEQNDREIGEEIENAENHLRVKFSKNAKTENMVKMEMDGHALTWGIQNANESKRVRDLSLPALKREEDPLMLEDTTSTVFYPSILPDVSLCYDLIGTNLKERLILHSAKAEKTFRFTLNLHDLSAKTEDGFIYLLDADGKTVYTMEPLYMYDAAGEISEAVNVSLDASDENAEGRNYQLTIAADEKWLNDPNRVYPVTIDPTITIRRGNGTFEDVHVNSETPTTNKYSSSVRVIGKNTAGSTSYTYVKFKLPADIKASNRVVSAQLYLTPNTSNSYSIFNGTITENPYLAAYETEKDWTPTTITWDNKPNYGSEMVDYEKVDSANRFYCWDITKVVNGAGLKNASGNLLNNGTFGVTLKPYNDEAAGKRCYFESGQVSTTSLRPQLQITYLNMTGLEDYWTYHEQEAGLAGSGYVNDFTGELTTTFEDVSLPSEKQPLSIYHVYTGANSGIGQSSMNVGSGWRLNIQETVEKKTIAGETKYLYIDGDGTQHFFENVNGKWTDDSGLDLTLTITSSLYTITDKKDNKKEFFVSGGNLSKIIDNKGNTVTLNYDANKKLLSVKDASDRIVSFTKDSSNRMTKMTLPDGRIIQYTYTQAGTSGGTHTDHCLTKVVFPGKHTMNGSGGSGSGTNEANFVYTENGTLTDMVDKTKNLGVHYDYKWVHGLRRVQTYKVCTYSTANAVSSTHSKYDITYNPYNNTYTESTPNAGRKELYTFNYMGQTVAAQDHEGSALFCAMGMSGGAKNKVTFASKTQKTISNLLVNHNFESAFSSGYTKLNSADTVSIVAAESGVSPLYGTKQLKVTAVSAREAGAKQTVSVPGGQVYTFSAYIQTVGNTKAFLSAAGASLSQKETNISNTGGYGRYDVSLDLTDKPATSNYTLTLSVGACKNSGGNVYFDAIQLETESCANRYNMIENGGFENAETGWTMTNRDYGNPAGVYDGRASGTNNKHSGVYGFMITGSPKYNKQMTQTLTVPVSQGEGIVYGVWIRSNALPNKDTANDGTKQSIGMTIELTRSGGSSQYSSMVITPTSNQWVYICNEMIANNNYTGMKVYLKVNKNANTTFFDDVQVYKDSFGESFTYDAKGNVVSVTDMAKNTQNAVINGNNDLSTYKDGKGYTYSFQYDGGNTSLKKHNLTRVTAPDGTYTSLSYLSQGPIQYVSVYDTNGTTAIRTAKTYSLNGTFLATSTDQLRQQTAYTYDTTKGLMTKIAEPYGTGTDKSETAYTYDAQTHNTLSVTKDGMELYYDYAQNRSSALHVKADSVDTKYTFTYTTLGNLSSVKRSVAGGTNVNLESYTYDNDARGNQTGITYANGQAVSMAYDSQDRLISVTDVAANQVISRLCYNANGLLGKAVYRDNSGEQWTKYQYDFAERYVGTQSSRGFGTSHITYDKNDNNTGYTATLYRASSPAVDLRYSTAYGYNNVNNMTSLTAKNETDGVIVNGSASYDTSGRVKTTRFNSLTANGTGSWTSYLYYDPNTKAATTSTSTHTTNLPAKVSCRFTSLSTSGDNADYVYQYTYDNAGNVNTVKTTLKTGTVKTENYNYDQRGQLLAATNYHGNGIQYLYTYDKRGNITQVLERVGNNLKKRAVYTYNGNITDELKTVSITEGSATTTRNYTYDQSGNPTKISDVTGGTTKTKTLTWARGKQLKSVAVSGGKTYTFYYDESGRTIKTVCSDGTAVQYHYDGDGLEYEEHLNASGSLAYLLKYFYDNDGKVLFVLYKTQYFGDSDHYYRLYHYIYNGLGEITDIVKVRDYSLENETAVQTHVTHYEYDPYGAVLSVTHKTGDTFGSINPIRYKGYYYDTNLEWYNLGARYYDPSVGRFLNADDLSLLMETEGDITDKNLYSYCDNNPIMRADNDGEFWHIIAGVVIGAAAEAACQAIAGEGFNIGAIVVAGAGGGAAAAFGPFGGAVVSGLTNIETNRIKGERGIGNMVKSFAVGAGLSVAGNATTKAVTSPEKIIHTAKAVYNSVHKSGIRKTATKYLSKAKIAFKNRRTSSEYITEFKKRNRRKSKGYANWKIRNGLSAFYSAKYNIYTARHH